MSYVNKVNTVLQPASSRSPLVVDLFAGCGGLSLGFEAEGFETHGFEMDADSCATYRKNLKGNCTQKDGKDRHGFLSCSQCENNQ